MILSVRKLDVFLRKKHKKAKKELFDKNRDFLGFLGLKFWRTRRITASKTSNDTDLYKTYLFDTVYYLS